MLRLPWRTQDGVLVAADDEDPGVLHVVGQAPRVVEDDAGRPRLRLVRWPAGPDGVAGHLSVDLTVLPPDEELDRLGPGFVPVRWESASVTLAGAGLQVTSPAVVGGGTVAAVATTLDDPGAATLEHHLTLAAATPLQATWDGLVRARLPEVEVVAALDRSEITRRLRDLRGPEQRTMTSSVVRENLRLTVAGPATAGVVPEELVSALRDWATSELLGRLGRGEDLTVRLTAAEVLSVPVRLAGTLGAVPAEQVEGCLRRLDSAPGHEDSELTRVIVLADWATTDHVTLEVEPTGSPDGTQPDASTSPIPETQAQALTFQDDQPRLLRLAARPFRWRTRATVGGTRGAWSGWTAAAPALSLTVPVAVPASPTVEVVAAGLDWVERWAGVEVTLSSGGRQSEVTLTAERPRASVPTADPGVSASARFTTRSGGVVEEHDLVPTGGHLVIGDPLRAAVSRTVVPTGSGWSQVARAMVELRHDDGERRTQETVPLDDPQTVARWSVPAERGDAGPVQWRLHASFRDGRFLQTPWQDSVEPVIVAPLESAGVREVQVVVAGLVVAGARAVRVTVTAGPTSETVEATEPGVFAVQLPPGPVTWVSQWVLDDGQEVAGPPGRTTGSMVVVSTPRG